MITIGGVEYGTAGEVAARLGRGVTAAMVRAWARRDGLTARRHDRRVVYNMDEATQIEIAKRYAGVGRPRSA